MSEGEEEEREGVWHRSREESGDREPTGRQTHSPILLTVGLSRHSSFRVYGGHFGTAGGFGR